MEAGGPGIGGLHHVTAICGDAQENLDFYTGVLGMRLVKRSVNQDAPDTYHLFYADGRGTPGTDLTFFPWPDMPAASEGHGLTVEVALAVPAGTLDWWSERLAAAGITATPAIRFGERMVRFRDPHGMPVALVETGDAREWFPWQAGPVPEGRQIVGLHGVRLLARDPASSAAFLERVLGFRIAGEEDGWVRHAVAGGGSGCHLDLKAAPDAPRGRWGRGGIHHVAWRVADEAAERALQVAVRDAGRRPTEVIDRFWFRSVYFLEPGGVLFELATDGPGFAVDEDAETLGERLVLPPWLEPERRAIERALPALTWRAREA
jgi:glyoxalase family protein